VNEPSDNPLVGVAVRRLVDMAFASSSTRQSQVVGKWIGLSHWLGGKLPDSLLVVSIQRAGRFDTLLRCMEDEAASTMASGTDLGFCESEAMLSEAWVGAIYEILRLARERNLLPKTADVDRIAHHLSLLRMTIEKHEIAAERKLEEPLAFEAIPKKEGDTPTYYDKRDPKRAHRMPMGFSRRGSIQWHALDVTTLQAIWLERRELSDRILAVLTELKDHPDQP
jgi:hypothetical protein